MFNERKFRAQLVLMDISVKELVGMLNMDESTFYRKIKAGGAFTREEINKLITILKFEDPMDIFFAKELAETQDTMT